MKIISLLALCLFIISSHNLEAQKEEKTKKNSIQYRIRAKFPIDLTHKYELSDSTYVIRTDDAGKKTQYKRLLKYYFSLYSTESPRDGFQEVKIRIDSMRYNFNSKKKTLIFNSTEERTIPLSFLDCASVLPTNNRQFVMKYSPYGEVVSITGEDLKRKRHLLSDKNFGIQDPFEKFIWQSAYATERLMHIADIQKNIMPDFPVSKDTTWTGDFQIQLNNINFAGEMKNQLVDRSGRLFYIEGQSDSLKAFDRHIRAYDLDTLCTLSHSNAKANFLIEYKSNGSIESIDSEVKGKIKFKCRSKVYTEDIRTKYHWKLMDLIKRNTSTVR